MEVVEENKKHLGVHLDSRLNKKYNSEAVYKEGV